MHNQQLRDRLDELFSPASAMERAVPEAAAPGNGDHAHRPQTGLALENLRRQQLLILESAGEGIFGLDLDGRHTFVNTAAARMLGYEVEELIGQPSHATWHHTKADGTPYPQTECPIYAAYRDGQVHHGDDEVFWRKDGTNFPVEYTSTPIREGDRLAGAVVTFRDISERKQREEELQKTRQIQSLLNALMRISLEDIPLDALLDRALDTIVRHAPFLSLDTKGGIFLVEGEANVLTLKVNRGLNAALLRMCARVPFGRCLCGRAAASGEIQFAGCVDERHEHQYEGMRPHGHYTVPIWSKDKVAGVIVVYLRESHVRTQQEHDYLTAVATTLASIIERKRAEEAVAARATQLAIAAQVSTAATTVLNTQDLLQTVADLTQENFGLYHAHIYLLGAGGNTLTLAAGAGEVGRRMVEREHHIPLDSEKSLVAKAARTRQGVLVDDVRQAPDFLPNPLLPDTRSELAAPLVFGDEVLGVLDVQSDRPGGFSNEDANVQTVLAAQVAAALHNARLYEQTQSALEEVSALQRIMTREGWQAFRAGRAQAARGYLFDQEVVRPASPGDFAFHGEHADAAAQMHAVTASDRSAIVRSLSVRDEPVGVLGLYEPDGQPLSPEEENLLESVSVQVAQALERARLLEQTQKRAVEIETVAQVSTVASTILDPEQLLVSVVNLTKQRFGLYHCHVYTFDEVDNSLALRAGADVVGEQMTAEGARIPLGAEQSLVARAARSRQPVIANDARAMTDWLPNPLLPDTRAEMAIPLIIGDQVLGVFDVQSDRLNAFGDEDARIYSTLASQIAVALQNARLYAEQSATVTRLRELDQLKSSFLANMSHELRTPLNSILGFADVMLEGLDGPLTDDMENDLKLVSRNGQHLLSLINDVLDMAKLEAGKMNLNVERFNLVEVLEEVLDITGPLAREKSLALQMKNGSTNDLELQADRIRLRQVMINLVGNAIKFTDQGSVTLHAERIDGHIRIGVKDTGIGVTPDQAGSIFEEFSQVDTSTTRKVGGTGLGLPISRRLVELHGGRLWVESSGVPGEGSTFVIELPLAATDEE